MIIEQYIINLIGGTANVDPSVITSAMKDAKVHVQSDGVVDTHPMFDLLHKYFTMHLLQLWGHVEDTLSEEVGDVKSTFAKSSSPSGETKWFAVYTHELNKITGP
jgi:hypothetical protein